MDKKYNKMKKSFNIKRYLSQINLTNTQEIKVKKIISKYEKSNEKLSNAFTKDSFNKEIFIKISSKTKEDKKLNKIQIQANIIEDIYKILSKKQKIKLKDIIDQKQEAKKKRLIKKYNR